MDTDTQFTVMTLTGILRREHRRMARGASLREYVHRQLALGNEPEHYRVDFLRNGVHEVAELLQRLGADFNRQQPNDKTSTNDLLDILESTRRTIVALCSDPD
jgi:hypothetical protein